MNEKLIAIYQAIIEGNKVSTERALQSAIDAGENPLQILNESMISAMREVGRLFEIGECFIPEMLISSRAMQGGMAILKPLLREGDAISEGRVIIGTVKGDLHDIGKNLVGIMLEGSGFEVIDLGVDVSPERFIQAVREKKPDILALSALLTTTMSSMKTTIDGLQEADLRSQVKVIIGGAPVTEEFSASLGADGSAPDASRAVTLARKLVIRK